MGLLGVLKIVKNSNIILLNALMFGSKQSDQEWFFCVKKPLLHPTIPMSSLFHMPVMTSFLTGLNDHSLDHQLGYPGAFKRLRQYLRDLIRPLLEMIEKSNNSDVGHPVLQKKGPSTVVRKLSQQINMFWHDEYPFRVLVASKSIWL